MKYKTELQHAHPRSLVDPHCIGGARVIEEDGRWVNARPDVSQGKLLPRFNVAVNLQF